MYGKIIRLIIQVVNRFVNFFIIKDLINKRNIPCKIVLAIHGINMVIYFYMFFDNSIFILTQEDGSFDTDTQIDKAAQKNTDSQYCAFHAVHHYAASAPLLHPSHLQRGYCCVQYGQDR